MFSDRGRSLLTIGGVCSAILALLHVSVIVMGPPGYRYFGAPDEFALQTEAGSSVPAVLTAIFAAIFAVYILRGLSAIPEALLLLRDADAFPPRFLVFSLISLAIGGVHAAGTKQAWRRLRHHDHP